MRDIDERIEVEIAGVPVACHKGCAWCCHQLVILTNWDDGRRILEAARSKLSADEFAVFVARVRAQAAEINALPHAEAEGRRWTCPLLRGGECVVYDVRPVACRSVVSPDSRCCQAMMEADEFDELPEDYRQIATEITERAVRLQIAINDTRRIDGAIESRSLLASLLDEDPAD